MKATPFTLFRRVPERGNPSLVHIFRVHGKTFLIDILIKNALEQKCVLKIQKRDGTFEFIADARMVGLPYENKFNAKIDDILSEAEACEKGFIEFVDKVYGN